MNITVKIINVDNHCERLLLWAAKTFCNSHHWSRAEKKTLMLIKQTPDQLFMIVKLNT